MTLERGVVVGQAAVGAHRMRELAEDQRARVVGRGRGPGLDRVDVGVHRADDVAGRTARGPVELDRTLVVQRPGRIARAHPARRGVVIRAVAALVAERPENHARMVLVALDHVLHAVDPRPQVARVAAELVVVRVRLDVRLVDGVEAVAVAQVEPVRVVRVVRAAHRVHVELLHQPRVRLHQLARHRTAAQVVVVVPVDAADPDGLSVDEQAPVADLDRAEADPARGRLAVLRLDDERVERGLLRRPEPRVPQAGLGGEARLQHLAAAGVEQPGPDRAARVDGEAPVGAGAREEVLDPAGVDVDAARDPGVPPLVLVLDEARVGPAHDRNGELVRRPMPHELRDVELGRRASVLADADGLAVQHDVQHALDAAEPEHDPLAAPCARDRERAPVEPCRVRLGHVRRPFCERHHDVRVVRRVEALHRPQARHLDALPACTLAQRVFGTRREAKLPVAVERALPGPLERGARRQLVEARQLRRLPAALSAGEEQRLECGLHLEGPASRSACAAASGATGLK